MASENRDRAIIVGGGEAAADLDSSANWTKQDRLLQSILTGAFAAMLVATPLLPSDTFSLASEGQITTPAMLWFVLAICGTIAWLLRAARERRMPLRFSWTDSALALFFAFVAVAGVIASADANRRAGWNMTASWATLGLTYYLARLLVRDARSARAMVVGIIALAAMFSAESLYEVFVTIPQNQAEFRRNPAKVAAEAGIASPPGSPEYEKFRSRLETQSPSATFGLENSFAGFLAPAIVLLLGAWLSRRPSEASSPGAARFVLFLAALVLLGMAVYFTHSNAAVVATLIALLIGGVEFFLPIRSRLSVWMRYAAAGLLLMIFLWPLAASLFSSSIASRLPKTLEFRTHYWKSCARLAFDHWLWGCGPGNFQDVYPLYKLPEASESIADPHNFFWEVFSTSGAPAALLLVIGVLTAAWAPLRRFLSAKEAGASDAAGAGALMGVRPIAIGAVLGVPLAILLSLSSGSMFLLPFLGVWIPLGIVPGVVVGWMLMKWVNEGVCPPGLIWLAWLLLAIHLTVSGGISNPGTGTLFFLLPALAAVCERSEKRFEIRQGVLVGLWGLAALGAAALAHYQMAYAPVLASQAAIARGDIAARSGTRSAAVEEYRKAAAADPWSPAPWHKLIEMELQNYLDKAGDSRPEPERLIEATKELLSRTPRASSARYESAVTLLAAQQVAPNPELLNQARDYLREATRLAPTRAVTWAYLSFLEVQTGEMAAARKSAAEALRIDALNPDEQSDLAKEPSPVPGRSLPGWLRELAEGRKAAK